MSKKVVTVHECDVCHATPATTWRLVREGSDMRLIDLCDTHARLLNDLYRKGTPRRKITPDVVRPPRSGPRTLRSVG